MSEKTVKQDNMFRFIDKDTIQSERITAPRYSYWASVFRVFFRKKINIVLIAVFVLILLSAFIVPAVLPYDPYENVTDAKSFNLNPSAAMDYFGGFSLKWILGSGGMGNSIFCGIMASARTSLILAVICAAINMTIGIILGAVWGYDKRFCPCPACSESPLPSILMSMRMAISQDCSDCGSGRPGSAR